MKRSVLCMIFLMISIDSVCFAETFPVVVEAKNHVILSAQRTGLIVEIEANSGDKVDNGELLACIYYTDILIEREGYVVQKKYWDGQASNLKSLNKSGLAPDTEAAKAVMERDIVANKLKMMDNLIRKSKIYAPYPGIVVKRHVKLYEWVQPGQDVIEVYNAEDIYFTANIPVEIAGSFKAGQKNSFFVPALDQNIDGILESFEPVVNVHSNTVKINWKIIKSEANDRKGLLYIMPGMKGTMTIE